MSRIKKVFENGKAFIAFITGGDPNLDITEKLVYAMEEAGADLIEIGIPFSDPTGEGPVIQASSLRALQAGVTTDKVFETIKKIRKNTQIPLAIMTYANVVFSYNTERFIKTMKEIGVDALILPDIPFEEKEEFSLVCEKYGIDFISLVAQTSGERVNMIVENAKGFIYNVSSLGLAENRATASNKLRSSVDMIKSKTRIPCAINFHISTPEEAKEIARISDGVIVGSEVVKICEEYGEDCLPIVKDFVREMKEAIKSV